MTLETRLQLLERKITQLEADVRREHQINKIQARLIRGRLSFIEVFPVALITFFIVLIFGVLSIRIETTSVSFIPADILVPLLGQPAFTAIISSVLFAVFKRAFPELKPPKEELTK